MVQYYRRHMYPVVLLAVPPIVVFSLASGLWCHLSIVVVSCMFCPVGKVKQIIGSCCYCKGTISGFFGMVRDYDY